MSVVLAHSSTLVAEVLTRALVVLGLDARPHRGADREPHHVFVCDAALGEDADLVLTGAGARDAQLDVARLHDEVTRVAAGHSRSRTAGAAVTSPVDALTPREQEVLALVANGASNRQIATALDITPNTARTHVQNLLAKLQVESRLAAGAFARRHGVVLSRV